MRVLFCGGGTAGHVNPSIAVAQTVMRNSSDNKVAYVATENGIENRLVDFKKYHIDVIGLKRCFSLKNFSFLYKQIKAMEKSKEIIREFRPDVIFGTGGYATYPVITAGKKLGVKTVLHESNAIPGKAILALEKKVDRIFVNFMESIKYFKRKEKILHTGNPIRSGFEAYEKGEAKKLLGIKEKYVILCVGGSLGAERINDAVVEMLENFVCQRKDIFLIWSTGRKGYDGVKQRLTTRGLNRVKNLLVSEYFDNMPTIMASADIVVSRAGAMTVSELAYMNKASILVPSPNVTNNHQYVNAKALNDSMSAVMVTEDRLYSLTDTVRELICDEERRKKLEKSIEQYAMKDANKLIFNGMVELL